MIMMPLVGSCMYAWTRTSLTVISFSLSVCMSMCLHSCPGRNIYICFACCHILFWCFPNTPSIHVWLCVCQPPNCLHMSYHTSSQFSAGLFFSKAQAVTPRDTYLPMPDAGRVRTTTNSSSIIWFSTRSGNLMHIVVNLSNTKHLTRLASIRSTQEKNEPPALPSVRGGLSCAAFDWFAIISKHVKVSEHVIHN